MNQNDVYNLRRFIDAQKRDYKNALEEIKRGRKESHWIWYIFPQLKNLGYSDISKYYGIGTIEEARAYLDNDLLRKNLIEISEAIYDLDDDILNIMGYPDNLKLNSSMTLFKYADSNIEIFSKVIDKFYDGEEDEKTLILIKGVKNDE